MSLEVKDVHFSYPARPHIKVLNGLSVKIERDTKVAFVGESGSGKSTVVRLLERFFDPDQGQVLVNGIDFTEIPVLNLWQRIGYVDQEPVLFATSFLRNILQGSPDMSEEALNEALELTQLNVVVQELSDKLGTFVGLGGCQFSMGSEAAGGHCESPRREAFGSVPGRGQERPGSHFREIDPGDHRSAVHPSPKVA